MCATPLIICSWLIILSLFVKIFFSLMISLMIRIRIATDRARQQFPAVIVSSHHGEKKDYIARKKQKAILRWKAIHPGAHRSYYFHICFIIHCRLEHCYTAHLLRWKAKTPSYQKNRMNVRRRHMRRVDKRAKGHPAPEKIRGQRRKGSSWKIILRGLKNKDSRPRGPVRHARIA